MMFSLNWWKIKRNRDAILGIVAVAAPVLGGSWLVYEKFFDTPKPQPVIVEGSATVEINGQAQVGAAIGHIRGGVVTVTTTPLAHVTLSLDDYEARLAARVSEALIARDAAHGGDRALLQAEIDELRRRQADTEPALAKAREQIAELEAHLGNAETADEQAARDALARGDLVAARELFEQIATGKAPDVRRAADAAFALGQIAEIEVRWADAARFYGEAARLVPSFANLFKATELAWRAGEFAQALRVGGELIRTANSEYGEDSRQLSLALNLHAVTLKDVGNYGKSEQLIRQAMAVAAMSMGEQHPGYTVYLNNLALVLRATGRNDEAEPLYRQAVAIAAMTLSEEDPFYATALNNLAGLFRDTGRYVEAEWYYRQALAIGAKTIGEGHPDYATRLSNLGGLLDATGRYTEAEPLLRQALDIVAKTLGEEHPAYASGLNNLASLLQVTGRTAEAETLFRQALATGARTLGEEHPAYATRLNNLAGLLQATGRIAEAEPLFRQALAIFEKSLGNDHPKTVKCRANLEELLRQKSHADSPRQP